MRYPEFVDSFKGIYPNSHSFHSNVETLGKKFLAELDGKQVDDVEMYVEMDEGSVDSLPVVTMSSEHRGVQLRMTFDVYGEVKDLRLGKPGDNLDSLDFPNRVKQLPPRSNTTFVGVADMLMNYSVVAAGKLYVPDESSSLFMGARYEGIPVLPKGTPSLAPLSVFAYSREHLKQELTRGVSEDGSWDVDTKLLDSKVLRFIDKHGRQLNDMPRHPGNLMLPAKAMGDLLTAFIESASSHEGFTGDDVQNFKQALIRAEHALHRDYKRDASDMLQVLSSFLDEALPTWQEVASNGNYHGTMKENMWQSANLVGNMVAVAKFGNQAIAETLHEVNRDYDEFRHGGFVGRRRSVLGVGKLEDAFQLVKETLQEIEPLAQHENSSQEMRMNRQGLEGLEQRVSMALSRAQGILDTLSANEYLAEYIDNEDQPYASRIPLRVEQQVIQARISVGVDVDRIESDEDKARYLKTFFKKDGKFSPSEIRSNRHRLDYLVEAIATLDVLHTLQGNVRLYEDPKAADERLDNMLRNFRAPWLTEESDLHFEIETDQRNVGRIKSDYKRRIQDTLTARLLEVASEDQGVRQEVEAVVSAVWTNSVMKTAWVSDVGFKNEGLEERARIHFSENGIPSRLDVAALGTDENGAYKIRVKFKELFGGDYTLTWEMMRQYAAGVRDVPDGEFVDYLDETLDEGWRDRFDEVFEDAFQSTTFMRWADRSPGERMKFKPGDEQGTQKWRALYRELGRETIATRLWMSDFIGTWASSSSDEEPRSLAAQWVASEMFGGMEGLDLEAFVRGASGRDSAMVVPDTESIIHKQGGMIAATLTAMHQGTQEAFERQGITHVKLYRGMKFGGDDSLPAWVASTREDVTINENNDDGHSFDTEMFLNPLSSWSTDGEIAHDLFARGSNMGILLAAEFPVSRVIGTALTGFGCLEESEMVLIGGWKRPLDGAARWTR